MEKTLKCNINDNLFEAPKYIKVKATKVEEIEAGKQNLYRDEQGNEYIVRYNKFQRRDEFVKVN